MSLVLLAYIVAYTVPGATSGTVNDRKDSHGVDTLVANELKIMDNKTDDSINKRYSKKIWVYIPL